MKWNIFIKTFYWHILLTTEIIIYCFTLGQFLFNAIHVVFFSFFVSLHVSDFEEHYNDLLYTIVHLVLCVSGLLWGKKKTTQF